ncbi:phosphoribosyltransferase family protein [Micromonospora palythoicola]|uniref:phosphoribosyltransferase family protein n=1 Tax=Micromonospora palythoicola TaxID=3120507 RepID=UPI002FCE20FE
MSNSTRGALLKHFRWIEGHADVWAIFRDAKALRHVVAGLVDPFRNSDVTAICGIESRGFLLGGAAAVELGVGFIPVRKRDGLFPGDKITAAAERDYRQQSHTLRLQRSSLGSHDRVLLVDDWIETGNQALTARQMVEQCGSSWVGCSVLVDQLHDDRRAALGTVLSLVRADELPVWTG